MPKTITIDDEFYATLVSAFGTKNLEGKLRTVFIFALKSMLDKYNKEILIFEEKYGMSFEKFEKLWDENKISNKHSYEVESDFIDWEMLEMEKEDLLNLIKKLKDNSYYSISDLENLSVFKTKYINRRKYIYSNKI